MLACKASSPTKSGRGKVGGTSRQRPSGREHHGAQWGKVADIAMLSGITQEEGGEGRGGKRDGAGIQHGLSCVRGAHSVELPLIVCSVENACFAALMVSRLYQSQLSKMHSLKLDRAV